MRKVYLTILFWSIFAYSFSVNRNVVYNYDQYNIVKDLNYLDGTTYNYEIRYADSLFLNYKNIDTMCVAFNRLYKIIKQAGDTVPFKVNVWRVPTCPSIWSEKSITRYVAPCKCVASFDTQNLIYVYNYFDKKGREHTEEIKLQKIFNETIGTYTIASIPNHSQRNNNVINTKSNYFVYIDNIFVGNEKRLDFSKIPKVIGKNYYYKFFDFLTNTYSPQLIKTFLWSIDTVGHQQELHITTPKAKDGYLYLNKMLSHKMKEVDVSKYYKINSCPQKNEITIVYLYNGIFITTKKEVEKLIKLKETKIHVLSVVFDENQQLITISFVDK